jgi:hypothetical protein
LPAAGFDDCEHRYIPSCSIPASDWSGPAFSSVVMDFNFCAIGERSPGATQKQTARGIPAPGGETYSLLALQVKAKQPENRPNIRDLGHFWPARRVLEWGASRP